MKMMYKLFTICTLAIPLIGIGAIAPFGTSVGNFDRQFEEAFDFHIAYPKSWSFEEREIQKDDYIKIWKLTNQEILDDPSRASKLDVAFGINDKVESAEDLLHYAFEQHPEIDNWHMIEGEEIIAVKSGDLPISNSSSRSFEYYLPMERQFIFVETLKHEYEQGAATVDLILSTISRATRPPEVKSIRILINEGESFDAGDELCYLLEVDDFPGALEEFSLETFDFQKESIYFNSKSVSFDQEEQSYKVCTQVRANSKPEDFLVSEIRLSNTHGQSLSCEARASSALALLCDRNKGYSLSLPPLKISHPDFEAPNLIKAQITKSPLMLHLAVQDQSFIGGGIIEFESGKTLNIFADQFGASALALPIETQSEFGWNKITRMAFFDENGETVVFKLSCGGGDGRVSGVIPRHYMKQKNDSDCTASPIEIIHYFYGENK